VADRNQPKDDDAPSDERSPITHDLDADGMDSESEADELEVGTGDEFGGDNDVEPDGVRETPVRH